MQLPKIFDSISSFRQEESLPTFNTLGEYISYILPSIRPWGEDLYEKENYLNKPWKEFRDDESFRDTVVYFFKEGREFMISINGDVSRGSWELMEENNQMILDKSRNMELYDLAFLNSNFFILRKHGTNKYFVLGSESTTGNLSWREYAEALSQVYESNNSVVIIVTVIVLMVIALLFLLI
ncbi:MAG: hypothetical protein AAF847_01725 [Bacteroidota bacterium]